MSAIIVGRFRGGSCHPVPHSSPDAGRPPSTEVLALSNGIELSSRASTLLAAEGRVAPGSGAASIVERLRGALPWPVWAGLVLTAATIIARLPGLLFNGVFDRDEAFLAVMGDVLRHDGRLYVDVIDRKPPIVPSLYAIVRDLSVDMRAVRFVVALLVLLNGAVVLAIVARLSGSRRAALVSGVLAVLGTAMFLPADAQAANFELWGLLPASVAILAVIVARTSPRAWVWFMVAGAAAVVAANCKQPYLAVLVPVLFEAARHRSDRVMRVGASFVGAALAFVPFVVRHDATRMIRWVWTENGDYLSGGVSTSRALLVGAGLTVVFLAFHVPLLYGVWASITRRLRLDATMWVWLVASVVVIPIGLRFFGHYYQQVVPPLAVLTGLALPGARRRVWSALAVVTAGLAVTMLVLAFVHRPDLTDYTAIGRHVQKTTAAGDRILVWGALPDVYVSAERDPSGVFLHDGYLTGNWASRSTPLPAASMSEAPFAERWEMFWADVEAHPPMIVIDAARPGTDWAAYSPAAYPIGRWLDRCYTNEGVIDGLTVWRRDTVRCPV